MRAQIAIEYILLIGLTTLLLLPIIYFTLQTSQESTRLFQARNAVETLKKAADFVYDQGFGSKRTILVYFPPGLNWDKSYIGKTATGQEVNEININAQTSSGSTDVYETTKGPIYGYFPNSSGVFTFYAFYAPSGKVILVPEIISFDLSPTYFFENMQVSTSKIFNITIYNLNPTPLTINLSTSGEIASWINLPFTQATIPGNGNINVSITVSVPSDASLGLHTGEIIVSDGILQLSSLFNINVFSEGGGTPPPSYLVWKTYEDPNCQIESTIFYQGSFVNISGTSWTPNQNVTLTLYDPESNIVPGFPVNVTADSNGQISYSWNPSGAKQGTYTLTASQGTLYATWRFLVRECEE
ncbi:MAG: hypothetical protein QW735_03095 [archaeon]